MYIIYILQSHLAGVWPPVHQGFPPQLPVGSQIELISLPVGILVYDPF